jgi:hypothetical protein
MAQIASPQMMSMASDMRAMSHPDELLPYSNIGMISSPFIIQFQVQHLHAERYPWGVGPNVTFFNVGNDKVEAAH